jgi:hypothetical protein
MMFETRKTLGQGAVFLLFLVLLFVAAPAHAYLDPASGTVIGQALVAVLAGSVVAFRLYWARFKRLFRRTELDGSEDQKEQHPVEPLRPAGQADRQD